MRTRKQFVCAVKLEHWQSDGYVNVNMNANVWSASGCHCPLQNHCSRGSSFAQHGEISHGVSEIVHETVAHATHVVTRPCPMSNVCTEMNSLVGREYPFFHASPLDEYGRNVA